jgi:NAD-dependent deacetylase
VRGPALRKQLAVARDRVDEAEAGSPQLADTRVDLEHVVEPGRHAVTHLRLEDERFEPLVANRLVPAGELGKVRDARSLEPDEVVRVVRDSLRVRFGEAYAHVDREAETTHGGHSTAVELVELIRSRQPCVVLTGAGISTESGIPDFRSPSGIWARYDPMEYATISAFRRDPVKVWEFYALRFATLTSAEPNAGHIALARLEQRGLVDAVVTQNIDGLHTRAGSRDVVEVHGSIRTASCLDCGERVPLADVVAVLGSAPAPPCPTCGEILKPDVVMFGELLPEDTIDRAFELARDAGVLLVVGSSLEVYPVAGLPEETLDAGGTLALVNRGETPYDRRATVRIEGGAGETLAALERALA